VIRSPCSCCRDDTYYRAFHRFGQAKFAYGGSILGSSQFTLLSKLPLKTMLNLKVVKIVSKIIHIASWISIHDTLCRIKYIINVIRGVLLFGIIALYQVTYIASLVYIPFLGGLGSNLHTSWYVMTWKKIQVQFIYFDSLVEVYNGSRIKFVNL